jgi:hypothetical protein
MSTINLTLKGGRAVVDAPYDPGFVSKAKLLGGKWDAGAKVWSFDARDESNVRDLLREVYGSDGAPLLADDLCRIRVTLGQQIIAARDAFRVGGRTVALAYGRDSGAKVGEGVVFLSKRPQSGGSAKNWCTHIPAGAVFEVRDFPRGAVDRALSDLGKGSTVEVLENAAPVNVAALLSEKAMIEKRLVEIASLLSGAAEDSGT